MEHFETPAFRLTLHDNLLKEVIVKRNVELQAEDVWESIRLSEKFKQGARFFVIVEGEEGACVSSESRRVVASEEYFNVTAALALCSNNTMLAIVCNIFLKVNRPKMPTKFFDSRLKALAWLKQQMENPF